METTTHQRTILRLGAAGLLGLTLFGAFALRGPDEFPAIVPADPLAAELTRCRKLGSEAAGNPACEAVWANDGAMSFSPPNGSSEH